MFACLVRDDPPDVITPYGYGGPVAAGRRSIHGFAEAYEQWCSDRGIVSTFILYHPLFGNQALASDSFQVEPLVGTIGWNLGPADLLSGMHITIVESYVARRLPVCA